MVAPTLWLWLSVLWLVEAVVTTSICDSGSPCTCNLGKLSCDCSTSFLKEVVLKPSLLDSSTSSISVANCFHLHVKSNAVSALHGLQQVSVTNVKQITLEENAFNWTTRDQHHTGLQINVTNCNIRQVPSYAFHGYIRDVLMTSVNISKLTSYAFTSLNRVEKIEFSKVNILEIETQSFKKLSVEFLTVLDSSLSSLPERTMTDVGVNQEVRLQRVKVDRFEKSSLKINSPRDFRIIKCSIGHIESNALQVSTRGDVSIHDNVFAHLERHAFVSIAVEDKYLREAGKQDFVFENNTVVEFENESLKLNTTGFDPRLDWIMVKQKCSCEGAKSWVDNLVVFSAPIVRRPMDRLIYCLNPKPTSLYDFQRVSCTAGFRVLTIVVVVVLVVISLAVIALVVYCGVRRRGKRYINVPTASSALRPPEDNKPHMLVVPDGKTYRETELHVIFEHADAVKATNYVQAHPERDDDN